MNKVRILPTPAYNALLDIPNYPADRYAPLADRLKRLLATRSDLLFIQADAILSLFELKENWLDRGQGVLPGTPSPLEFWALEAAIDRVEAEGIERLVARHQLAARASRAGLRALGIEPWVRDDSAASALVTAAPVPPGVDAETLIATAAELGVALGRGFGDIKDRLVRFDHTGARTAFASVVASVGAAYRRK